MSEPTEREWLEGNLRSAREQFLTLHAEPDPDTFFTGEEPQRMATCKNCGGEIFLDQEFDPADDGEPTPSEDRAYWQHNDDRYRPNALSWCRP